jgi:hypothetical protein
VDDERRGPSRLINAFWGGNISFGSVGDVARGRMRRVSLLFTLTIAAAIGLIIGLLNSVAWGAVAAASAVVVLGLTFRAVLRDYT